MKKLITALTFLLLLFCTSTPIPIFGIWSVDSKFYEATYQIIEEEQAIKGQILHYNDGTSTYHFKGHNQRYIFNNLVKKETVYVDAITGATPVNTTQKLNSIAVKSKDTLLVTTFIQGRALEEIWVRK